MNEQTANWQSGITSGSSESTERARKDLTGSHPCLCDQHADGNPFSEGEILSNESSNSWPYDPDCKAVQILSLHYFSAAGFHKESIPMICQITLLNLFPISFARTEMVTGPKVSGRLPGWGEILGEITLLE